MSITYFISGHLDLTQEEFDEYYVPLLEAALVVSSNFVVGDAKGADTLAQKYLSQHTQCVTVYHMFERPRNNVGFETKGGFKSDTERDEAMTRDSDVDIAWVRSDREKSGTAKNLSRRAKH